MQAARIHQFGPPEVIVIDDLVRPTPGAGELLVRVIASGVGPWDALIREGKSKVSPPPPFTLGSDLSGIVEAVGPGIVEFKPGDAVYGVTNPQFCGANAEYAVASANMMAKKPQRLTHIEAASVPVVAVTAWQMLFEYAHAVAGQRVLILGAAGNVGAYAVQFAISFGMRVIAAVGSPDIDFVQGLGAEAFVDDRVSKFEEMPQVDVILDTVGGNLLERSLQTLKPKGTLVSVVSMAPLPQRPDVQVIFFYAEVTTARLSLLTPLFEKARILPRVGTVLPLSQIRSAHQMLGGAPHQKGKIALQVAT